MGLRERKKAETRAALSWAAIRLTVERGFENVKVEDIAAAAGVSPRTFNNYFASKGEAISPATSTASGGWVRSCAPGRPPSRSGRRSPGPRSPSSSPAPSGRPSGHRS